MAYGHFGGFPPGLFGDPKILKLLAQQQRQQSPQGPLPSPPIPVMQAQQQMPQLPVQAPNTGAMAGLVAAQGEKRGGFGGFIDDAFGADKMSRVKAGLAIMAASAPRGFGQPRPTLGQALLAGVQQGERNVANETAQRQALGMKTAIQQGGLPAAYEYAMETGNLEQAKMIHGMMASDIEEGYTLSPGQARFNARNQLVSFLPKGEEGVVALTPKETAQVMNELRDDLRSEVQNQGVNDIVSFYQNGKQGFAMANAYGDVIAIQSMAKINDPGSVVRQGEFEVWAQRSGLGDQIVKLFKKVDENIMLTTTERQKLSVALDDLYETRKRRFKPVYDSYVKQYGQLGIEDQFGLAPGDVLINPFATVRTSGFKSAGQGATVVDGADLPGVE
jgi:hypothetical protein